MLCQQGTAVYGWLVEFCFTYTEAVDLLGTGAQDDHLDFHTPPEICCLRSFVRSFCLMSSDAKSVLGTIYKVSFLRQGHGHYICGLGYKDTDIIFVGQDTRTRTLYLWARIVSSPRAFCGVFHS